MPGYEITLPGWLSEPYPGAATVLIDELDAGGLQGSSERGFIRGCDRNTSVDRFHPPDGGYANL